MNKNSGVCKVEGCDREVVARGWCRRHYQRWKLKGDPGPAGLVRLPAGASCTVDGCDEPNVARGYCEMHRWRLRAHGEPGPAGTVRKDPGRPCSVDGCGRKQNKAGLCATHYQRRLTARALAQAEERAAGPIRPKVKRGKPCLVDGCDRKSYGRGYCALHYNRLQLTGETGPVGLIARGPGNGYKTRTVEGRSKLEHRVIVEQLLGRKLKRHETVHHVNGQRDDNHTDGPLRNFRSGNLELWSSWQPAGQRVADKVEFAAALLREYAPDLLAPAEVRQALSG